MLLNIVASAPIWVILLGCALLFTGAMFLSRWTVQRYTADRRQKDLIGLANSMNGPTGATLAFLVGFAVSITWATISTAQSGVEKIASQAQEIAWLSERLDDPATVKKIDRDLQLYLTTIANEDRLLLAGREFDEMPSFKYLDALERDLRTAAKADSANNPEASKLVGVGAEMAVSQAELNAVARRDLPPEFIQLLVFTGLLSAATVGIVATRIQQPYLIVGWALVTAMGISVVLSLYDPFSGSVQVNFQPLLDAAERIRVP